MTTSTSSPVRMGLMGTGGRLRTVVRALLQEAPSKALQITCAYDPDPEALETARRELGSNFETVDSEEALAGHPEVDWVFIGSWNSRHARQCLLALKAGKQVFCEKPLAITTEDCVAVCDAVRKSGRTFAFGLVLRYSPLYQQIHHLIGSGRIGRILSFEFNETLGFNHGGYIFGNWRRESAHAGSHLLEKCCHDLDLANWIIGSLPVSVASFGGRDFFVPANEPHIERIGPDARGNPAYSGWNDPHRVNPFSEGADIVDNQVAILHYANGVRGTFHTNCNAGLPERRFYICGTEGTLRADALTGVIELQRIGHDSTIERIDTGHAGGHAGGDQVMAKGLAQTLLQGETPLASVTEGLQSCVVALGIDQAMREGKVIHLGPTWESLGIGP